MPPSPCNAIAIQTQGQITRVTFSQPKLDESNAEPIGQQLNALITGADGGEVHLDFQGVDYMSSVGLGKLVSLHTRAAKAGHRLVLTNLSPFLCELLTITRLDKILNIRHADDNQPVSEPVAV